MKKNIFWFRQDLRIEDNPGLIEAAKTGTVLPIYIFDDKYRDKHQMGEASRLWLYHSLETLSKTLEGKLTFFKGDPHLILKKVIREEKIDGIYWNRCYEPWRVEKDGEIKHSLKQDGLTVKSFNGSLLWEPWHTHKKDRTPFKVFTPFYQKGCLYSDPPRKPLGYPENLQIVSTSTGLKLEELQLIKHAKWEKKIIKYWEIGEKGATERLHTFLKQGIEFYRHGRDFPAKAQVSFLSPHLHFGEISPHTIWHAVQGEDENHNHFRTELGWREFSYYLLYHFPTLPEKNFQEKYDQFPWRNHLEHLHLWQRGQTGVPFVDAGMRELWETGYMHNRMRMVVGSFLVKNLLIHWHEGEAWFWNCLVDADLANNSASWQWIAGCGADAAPYFRIFNPVTQGEKFDPDGEYTRRYLPELQNLPTPYLFSPWNAPKELLEEANIQLGVTYPYPIVDLKESRQEALQAFDQVRSG